MREGFNLSRAPGCEVLITITQEEREWARQLSEEKYILDRQSLLAHARLDGLKEGRQEGQKILEEAAKNLRTNGVSIEIIAKSTGLSQEEIAQL